MAKIRLDYVTNSSSSSFIIAKHKDCTRDEVKEMVSKSYDKIKELLKDSYDWFYFEDIDIKHAIDDGDYDKATEYTIDEITDGVLNHSYYDAELELNGWTIIAGEASSDGDSLVDYLLYDRYILSNTEHLKFG